MFTLSLLSIILIILFVLIAYIFLSGKTYIFFAIKNTFLKGKKGPSIFDIHIFPTRKIEKGKIYIWKKNLTHFTYILPKAFKKKLIKTKTNSFLVAKNNSIIFERYYNGSNQFTLTNSFSAAKSIVSLLVGIAIEKGYIKSETELVSNYLPEYKNDSFKSTLTIAHLLNMSSGLKWNESGSNPFSENAEAYYGDNLNKMMLELKLENEPGTYFNYQSGNTQILAQVLEKATGKNISKLTEENLWKKLGTQKNAYWSLDNHGTEKSYCCFYATTRDFAKLGQLVLQNGRFNNEQIISKAYISKLWETNLLPDIELNEIPNTRYSHCFWKAQYRGRQFIYFRGILGQFIIVLPDEDMIIVRTGHKRKDIDNFGHPKDLYDYIDIALKVDKDLK